MKLITERSYDYTVESDKKNLYIMGVFSTADKQNRNGRIYKKSILEREIKKLSEQSKQNNLLGELEHPERPEVNLSESAIKIEELAWNGNNVMGKARVLTTPKGQILKSLLDDGVKVGISSRALGEVDSEGYVTENLNMLTWDAVASPSNYGSWMKGIYEAKEFTSKDIVKPSDDEVKEFLKEHERKIWQVLGNIFN